MTSENSTDAVKENPIKPDGTFEFSSADIVLHGKVDLARSANPYRQPVVIYVPGISGDPLSSRTDSLAETFAENGFNFVRFTFRGDEPGNTKMDSTLYDEVFDTENLLKFLQENNFDLSRFGMIGKSFGGNKIIALQDERIACAGMLACGINFGERDDTKRTYKTLSSDDPITLPTTKLDTYKASTIIIHGGVSDTTVPLEKMEQVVNQLSSKTKVQFHVIEGAGHSFDNPDRTMRPEVGDILVPFFKQNLTLQ